MKTTQVKKPKKSPKYIYTIKDKCFPDFEVLNTANAWWLDRVKVGDLISAFKIDATIEEACVYSGISLDQYKYFLKRHKEFSTIRDNCKNLPTLKARQSVVKGLDQTSVAFEYLKRKRRKEFGDSIDHTTDGEKFEVTGIVINTPKPDAKKTTSPSKS